MSHSLQQLLTRPDVWQASRAPAANGIQHALPTGHVLLDRALHQRGWPRAALTELLTSNWGIGEMQMLLPTLSHCSHLTSQRLFLVCPPYLPYAPTLQAHGVRLDRLLVLSSMNARDMFWSIEQILRSGACSCLLGWLPETTHPAYRDLRRLQIAARAGNAPVFLFRPARMAQSLSPASLRLRLHSSTASLQLDILKQRGGCAGQRVTLPHRADLLQELIAPSMLPVTQSGAHATPVLPVARALPWYTPARDPASASLLH